MAYQDALFQLGMDLTRSSTAQEEDFGETARVAHTSSPVSRRHDLSKKQSVERDDVAFAGNHLIIDLFGADRLDDIPHVEFALKRCAEVAGATPLHVHLHRFTPTGGISGVVVLSDSHISFHSWPETGYAALDVFMRGGAKPDACIAVLKQAFTPDNVVVKAHVRGRKSGHRSEAAPNQEAMAIAQGETAVRVARQRAKVRKAA